MSQISADVPEKTVKTPLTLQEIGELLIKHYKLHDGLYDISIEFRFGFGAMPGDEGNKIPGQYSG